LHLELVDSNLLLIVIPHKNFEIAFESSLIGVDFSNTANFNVYIFIDNALIPLNQRINME